MSETQIEILQHVEILKRALHREKEARKLAEKILEEKSINLYLTTEELKTVNTQLEDLLDEQKSQLQGVFENIVDAYLVMDLSGNVLKMNDAAVELFGYNVAKEKINVTNLIYENDYEYAMQSFSELKKEGYFKDYEARIITKSGERKRVHINASIVYDKQSNPIAAQGIIRDITVVRENEKNIKAINNIAKAILGKINAYEIGLEIVNIIVDYLGTNDCVIYKLNNETKLLEQIAAFGEKVKEQQICNKLKIPIGQGIVGHVAKTGKAEIVSDTSKDNRYILDDKKRLSEITVPIISNNVVIGIIDSEHQSKNYFKEKHLITLTNIARIISMQLNNAINNELRQKAEEKNTVLLKELEKSNVELKEYAHVVSHDLKSPLRNINALVNWLKEDNYDKFDEDSIKNFDLIESTLENMEQLISDILDYSSVDSENVSEENIDLNQILDLIIEDQHESPNLSIRVINKLPQLKGDKTRYKQLFQNLISNAIKYNNNEKVEILIDYSSSKTQHKFSVKDNGVGIEKKYFKKIFEMFESLNSNKESTGIGLSIVKKIIEFYKGTIWLESEIGIGTTFYFTIPKQDEKP
jgi:PAS domain S-box-containing protein